MVQVFTRYILPKMLYINALDFSQEMLNILHEDAIKEGLYDKFTFTCNTWSGFESQENFDIVFHPCHLHLRAMLILRKCTIMHVKCVFLGWGGKRESSLLDPIFKVHDKALNVPAGSEKLRAWLESANIASFIVNISKKNLKIGSSMKKQKNLFYGTLKSII